MSRVIAEGRGCVGDGQSIAVGAVGSGAANGRHGDVEHLVIVTVQHQRERIGQTVSLDVEGIVKRLAQGDFAKVE